MRVNAEKVIATLVVLSFTLTLMSTLIVAGNPLTREEAIEISRNSELVKQSLAIARSFSIETHYYNLSALENLRQWHSDPIFQNASKDSFWEEKLPDGHTAWEVIWWFNYYRAGGLSVQVIVDAETGTMIHEAAGGFD